TLQYPFAFFLSLLVSANLIWYFISPYEFISNLFDGTLGEITTGFWIGLAIIMFVNLIFIKRSFCASVCPYSKLQSIMLDDSSLVINFDKERKAECMNCKACVKVCPVNIDIREGLNPACINCAECIDICKSMTSRVGKKTLIDYTFGKSGINLKRTQVLIFSTITIICLISIVLIFTMKSDIEINVSIDNSTRQTMTDKGYIIVPVNISISNKINRTRELSVNVMFKNDYLVVSPKAFLVIPDSHQKYPLKVMLPISSLGNNIDILINYDNNKTIVKTLYISNKEVNR
ncbi:MAG: hypothetical protein N2738_09835, partial [Thermodesulfovibrionales bacterium]|nr:hypothetical protein [Thermodesulfovibrionales bacterium]